MRRVALALLILAVTPASAAGQAANGSTGGDRVVITGPVTIDRGETADDVVVIDGPVSVAGRVRGDLVVVSGRLRISGTVDGDVVAVADRATLAPGARIGGDLIYGDKRPVVPAGATVEGDVDRVSVGEVTDPVGFIGAAAIWIAVSVSALVLGLLLLWLAPRALDAAFAAASTSLGLTIGWGLLLFFGLPILAVIALVTLVGIPLGVALLLALLPLYAIGYTTSAWLLGRRLVGPPRGRVLAFLAGLAILRVLAIIPILGGIVWFAATVVGLGALLVATWRARRDYPERASPVPA
jgi:cytoskeletal protein CcmA (bactofilin family)